MARTQCILIRTVVSSTFDGKSVVNIESATVMIEWDDYMSAETIDATQLNGGYMLLSDWTVASIRRINQPSPSQHPPGKATEAGE